MAQDAKLTELDEAIESGITRSSTDGLTQETDLKHLEKVRRDLREKDPTSISDGKVRPRVSSYNLSGAF